MRKARRLSPPAERGFHGPNRGRADKLDRRDSSARVYYRVNTRQSNDTGERFSQVVHGGSVPFPWANVNADGNDCTCAP